MAEQTNEKQGGLNISTKSFITAIAVIFGLMVLCYVLTFIIPSGAYTRIEDANGNTVIDTGSAKAFMLIPLIVPVAEFCGIPVQLCIVAYAFGDGFSNVFYPTNPVLLISLGIAGLDYGKWFKWSWKFQIANLLLTSLLLLFGLAVGYC